jgi:hypothetical protein
MVGTLHDVASEAKKSLELNPMKAVDTVSPMLPIPALIGFGKGRQHAL